MLQEINVTTRSTGERVAKLEEKLNQVAETVNRCEVAIYGNGTTGLKSKVDTIEQKLCIIDDRHKSESQCANDEAKANIEVKKLTIIERVKSQWAIIILIIAAFTNVVVEYVKYRQTIP